MDGFNPQRTERDTQRLRVSREELVERIAVVMREDGVRQALPGLHLARLSAPLEKLHSVLEPSLCVIAQGSKIVFIGGNRYQYDPFRYLLTTLELPRVSQVAEASRAKPYLSLRLELDPNLVGSVMIEAGQLIHADSAHVEATTVSHLDPDLMDAVVRLVRLVDAPAETRMLIPLIKREIIFRLLIGDQGGRLSHMIISGGYTSNIAKAVEQLRQNFDQSVRIEDLAQKLGMSVSSFHQHFKSVTAMSPLQFQKRLRLQEARRLMLSERLDATSAAYQVGYNDAAHFNREYKSLFGDAPIRDIQRLREETLESAVE
ncbi:MAG TPA: AraC family transcriptional regulator [Aggregatilineales bacterium]|nr:AraC family transcriptional regulator [Aggregatilineales bacterium]